MAENLGVWAKLSSSFSRKQVPSGAYINDMDDAGEIAKIEGRLELNRLTAALRFAEAHIKQAFTNADNEVKRLQSAYMICAQSAAWLGATAVVFAILQLSDLGKGFFPSKLLPWMEFALAGASVVVALIGLGGRRQQKWFEARHRAEQLRLLKFKFLMSHDLWVSNEKKAEEYRQNLDGRVTSILQYSFIEVQHWVIQGSVPDVVRAPGMSDAEWKEFARYYRERRLQGQLDYLSGAKDKNLKLDDRTRVWPSVLFFGSVALVLAHFSIELAGWRNSEGVDVFLAKLALLLAASLPVCGAGLRVVRGVFEYARNASRYQSTHHALLQLGERLRAAHEPATAFREIGFCELVMEANQREWARLMIEAEWFG